MTALVLAVLAALVCGGILISTLVSLRQVVPTNMVHIIQTRKATKSYGSGLGIGNVYYDWPSWLPIIGITVTELPVSNFNLRLEGYEAYDKDRVPFSVDVVAFFRVSDTGVAAQRVSDVEELEHQLTLIVQGAVRKVLASANIDTIMLERAQFGTQFTHEVEEQLKEWGVQPVKAMELMDIRDGKDSKVIHNIMAKKTSHIEMESRTEVASNKRSAEVAEISAQQEVDVRKQEAEQLVGQRRANKDLAIGVAAEQAKQEVLAQARATKERDMAVIRVEAVQNAEIARERRIVEADAEMKTRIIQADGAKQSQVLEADGKLEAKKREATGIQLEGDARGAAATALQMASVTPQIELAREIGQNEGYQKYLISIKQVEATISIGVAQAEALKAAEIKVIANSGNVVEGVKTLTDLLTTKGGTAVAGAIEAFGQTPTGDAVLKAVGARPNGSAA